MELLSASEMFEEVPGGIWTCESECVVGVERLYGEFVVDETACSREC